MGETLYLECNSGISGDMTVAALLDLGASEEKLISVLSTVPETRFDIHVSRVMKSGIDACDFQVHLDFDNHDHDMEFLHGTREFHHGDTQSDSDSDSNKEHSEHIHRNLADILRILDATKMTEQARATAVEIFQVLAEAESKAHNLPIEEVHFHEVGAIDSIVDIISIAVCLDDLNVTDVIVPYLMEGNGMVRTQHGLLPIPVPAVSNIVTSYQIPLRLMDIEGEFVTPTGAATVAAIMTSSTLPKQMKVKKIGIGAGKREYERPSILRAMLLSDMEEEDSSLDATEIDVIYKLEANIDDCSGEAFGYTMELLFAAGARDVHYTPVFMKKQRPSYLLTVICGKDDIPAMEEIIFRETTTIGIRRVQMERTILPRESRLVDTKYGKAMVKVCKRGQVCEFYPEYESVVLLSKKAGLPYKTMYRMIQEACEL